MSWNIRTNGKWLFSAQYRAHIWEKEVVLAEALRDAAQYAGGQSDE
jgi:hypothetical protein